MIAQARRLLTVAVTAVMAVVVSAPGPVRAQSTVQDRINSALSTWMVTNGVSNAGLAVMRDNRLVGSYGYNQMSAESPAHVASLSKAITAVCFLSLIDDRRLAGFRTGLYSLPPSFLDATGPWSPGVANITVEQLLRHRSRIVVDPSQDGLGGIPNADSSDLILIRRALAERLTTMPVGEVYNNINYAILGYIIQTITRESYESYCRRTALAPRGAPNARIGAGTRALGAFGGWEISAVEYAMFARAYDPRSGLLSQTGHDFINALANSSSATASLGMFVVRTASGRNLFHHGSWGSTATTPQQFSSFFAMWDNGISVVVTYDRNLTGSARLDLDNALRRAAYSPD